MSKDRLVQKFEGAPLKDRGFGLEEIIKMTWGDLVEAIRGSMKAHGYELAYVKLDDVPGHIVISAYVYVDGVLA